VTYELKGGTVEKDLCYWGDMVFVPHLMKLLSKGQIVACVVFGEELSGIAGRKLAARLARESVERLVWEA
jgi:hypothetical protein